MKMKKLLLIGMALFTVGTVTPQFRPQQVQASQSVEVSKSAVKSKVKISIGGKTSELVGYNIDGYNYFRVADLAYTFDMKIDILEILGKQSVRFIPSKKYEGTKPESIVSADKVNVGLKDYTVYYEDAYYNGKAFNLDGRNYVQLKTVVEASNASVELYDELVLIDAKRDKILSTVTYPTIIKLDTKYDNATNTIIINTQKIDYHAKVNELFLKYQNKTVDQAKEEYKKSNEDALNNMKEKFNGSDQKKNENEVSTTSNKTFTSVPEKGVIYAKILKDPTQPAYVNGKPNVENLTDPYKPDLIGIGGCIWYARGRFEEVHGIKYSSPTVYDVQRAGTYDGLMAITDPNKIVSGSIAVFNKTHAVFVEYVERDSSGNPINIYFSEANTGSQGVYRPDMDGKISKLDFNSFINYLPKAPYVGCITIKN